MRARFIPVALLLLLLGPVGAAAATSTPAAVGAPSPARALDGVRSWAFAIGNRTLEGELGSRYGAYDLVVVDAQEARPAQVAEIRAAGAVVLGYLSVGTIEEWRPWYPRLRKYRIAAWRDWEGEYFARVARRGFRREIAMRIAPRLYGKGFDGLFLDNVDMIETYRGQRAGMRKLVAALGRLVHSDGGVLFSQNGYALLGPLLEHLDGWNREDVSTFYDFDRRRYRVRADRAVGRVQRELRAVAGAGLLVTATDYTPSARGRVARRAVAAACAAGALPFVSDIGLRRIPPAPPRCD